MHCSQQKDYEAGKVYMETADGDAIEYEGESSKKIYQRGRSRCADCRETFNTQNELKVFELYGCISLDVDIPTAEIPTAEKCRSVLVLMSLIIPEQRHRLKFHVAKKCGVCQEVFANQYDLRLHARLVHEVENDSADESAADTSKASETDGMADSMLRCSICGIVEQTTDALEEHKASHDNSLKCTICGVVVKHKSNLILHMRIHVSSVAAITRCKLRLTDSSNYTLQTDKKFFKCDKCEKTFVHKSSLRMHLQTTHSDVKSKECSHCPMKFKTTSQLNQHLVTHSGEKRHECPVCGKAFSQKYNMTAHHRSTHLSQKSPRKLPKSTQ